MSLDLVVRNAALPDGRTGVDIACAGGRITAIEPGSIRSVADLQAYVRRCKAHYWGHSDDTRFLHWLIEREVQFLIGR